MTRLAGLVVFLMAMSGFAADRAQIAVHGHRGARAVMPENTMPAFEYALKQGVDVLELDLGVTKDNVLVVSHDAMLHAPVCTGPRDGVAIRELTLAQVREYDCGAKVNPNFPKQTAVPGTRMPTFDEVLARFKGSNVEFNVETKISAARPELAPSPEEFARLVLEAIRKHGVEKRVILQSFDFRTLKAMKALAPEIRLSALWERGPRSFVEVAREAGAGIVSPAYALVTPERVAEAHAAGLQVVPWTVNDRAGWDKMIAAKVDAIISDDPAALTAYLRERGLRK